MNSVFIRSRRSVVLLNKVISCNIQGPPVAANKRYKMGTTLTRFYSPKDATECNTACGSDPCSMGTISNVDPNSEYIEAVVCKDKDMKNNEMKVFNISEDGRVLVVKQKGQFSAVGTKCTHYGAPLVNGALGDGRVRCPWHGACFNLKTGDIEDFPGFDSLPCYQVTVTEKGDVKVRAKLSDLQSNKRIKEVSATSVCSGMPAPGVVIVGGGPSGATCAETLRSEGYRGSITLIAKEPHLPYDRIKITKLGTITEIEKLEARTREYYHNADIRVLTGVEATKVDINENLVHMNNGERIAYSALYLATGSKPRVPDIPGIKLENIFTMRDYADNVNILKALGDKKDKDVLVLGLSFIGLEVASSFCDKAKSMTVVGNDTTPLGRIFGNDIGVRLQKLFEEKDVKFHFNTSIKKCVGEDNAIKSVELNDSTNLPADILVLGVGTTYYTDFLRDSGVELLPNGAVNVDAKLETSVKNVYAGGDIAYAPVFAAKDEKMNIGHIGLAQFHGRVAALNIIKKEHQLRTVPYFWTALFGKSIRYSGCGVPASNMIVGSIDELKFVMFFFDQADKVIAVASCMRDPVVSQFAEYTHQGKTLYKKDLKDDPFSWTNNLN